MFSFCPMKKNKAYWVNFCLIQNPELVLNKESAYQYYCFSDEEFVPPENLQVIKRILVTKSFRKHYVKEVMTGLEIPFLACIFYGDRYSQEYLDFDVLPENQGVYIEGDSTNPVMALATSKIDCRRPFIDDTFLLKEATKKEIYDYLKNESYDELYKTVSGKLALAWHYKNSILTDKSYKAIKEKKNILARILKK